MSNEGKISFSEGGNKYRFLIKIALPGLVRVFPVQGAVKLEEWEKGSSLLGHGNRRLEPREAGGLSHGEQKNRLGGAGRLRRGSRMTGPGEQEEPQGEQED